ncbi:hypothetical protein SZ64_16470 [Erythrobacter sp. SG61-1L]|uniref:hypothetical protein n=1 Tax=Erythrobacter sp. SG61-1L TaxID=1603897 RepID=UPI0006C933C6|nr:hypothetical protein [Erythrobacter sp. SG61-1L]KPL69547.1 hypothetical protein SZ64_16470 [Erythrobacter sp. SG61-1L]
MRSLALVITMAMMPSACSNGTGKPAHTVAACDIALDYAGRFKAEWEEQGRPIAVSDGDGTMVPAPQKLEQILADNPALKGDPEVALTLAAADLRNRSVVEECRDLRGWLRAFNIVHDDKQIAELTLKKEWPVAILSMSLPAISEDGSTALLYVSEYSGPLAGATMAVTYKRNASGKWLLHDKTELSVS